MICKLDHSLAQHGLSYTQFKFSNASIQLPPSLVLTKDSPLAVSVTVQNIGSVASAVTVQVYCSFSDTAKLRVMRHERMLCAFTKIFLEPLASTVATVSVTLRTLARWDPHAPSTDLTGASVAGTYVVDAGRWELFVGDCSGAGSAIGLRDAVPCEQASANVTLPSTIRFNGKN